MYAQQWIGFHFSSMQAQKTVYVHTVTEAAMQFALKPSSSQLHTVCHLIIVF
jgi:hypothetical protein